jgi:hypothetical protein
MTTTLQDRLHFATSQEEVVFQAASLMQPYIEDLDSIDYAFLNVDARDQVARDIWGLRDRSCQAVAKLFERFSRGIDHDEWFNEAMAIVFPFLQDQFEVRLRLLNVYWERLKAEKFRTANPDFLSISAMISPLAALIQECGDLGFGEIIAPQEQSTASTEVVPTAA